MLTRATTIIEKEIAKNPEAFLHLDLPSARGAVKGLGAIVDAAAYNADNQEATAAEATRVAEAVEIYTYIVIGVSTDTSQHESYLDIDGYDPFYGFTDYGSNHGLGWLELGFWEVEKRFDTIAKAYRDREALQLRGVGLPEQPGGQ